VTDQIGYIGKRIQQLSTSLAIKTLQIAKVESTDSIFNQLFDAQENAFFYLGEYLCTKDESMKDQLIAFVKIVVRHPCSTPVSWDQTITIVHSSRTVVMELMEAETKNLKISIETLLDVMKELDSVYHLICNTIMSRNKDILTLAKSALDESNKDLQTTLRELSALKNALNQATIFSITDKDDNIVYVNDNFCKLYKYTREELIGKNHYILYSQLHPDQFFVEIREKIKNGEVWTGEIYNKAKDGSIYCIDTTLVPFIDQNGETYQHISIQYDITEKKKTEEMLLKTEKLSMVGELAAGIAHEIRNPLTTIKGFVQLLSEYDLGKSYASTILDEIDRINFIVSEFMVFAKPHTIYFSKCNINETVKSVIKFLEPEAHLKNVIIECKCVCRDIWISGEKNQLKQVFLNMIKNAIEAMPAGGKVFVTIESNFSEIVISIEDTGRGMTADQVRRLGEPFYTTKENGNGLGLMVSFKIIETHRGAIEVKSELNRGTKFIISFPKTNNREDITFEARNI
jgi:PAS domain S-box-containing protein